MAKLNSAHQRHVRFGSGEAPWAERDQARPLVKGALVGLAVSIPLWLALVLGMIVFA
ncbi:hypothetical protein [Allosphingosinicella deserti]|uniref:hypothetical protein n=1 Tax=Allosphingosinicella deserti TaxID=2116704 RepID=UPI001305014F|nr:hypothetical protein [Sphingomonas deserti]